MSKNWTLNFVLNTYNIIRNNFTAKLTLWLTQLIVAFLFKKKGYKFG